MAPYASQRLEVLLLADEPLRHHLCAALHVIAVRITLAESPWALMLCLWQRIPDVILVGASAQRSSIAAICAQVRHVLQTPILVVEDGADEAERISWLDHGADDVLALSATTSAELLVRCHALRRRIQRQRRHDPASLRLHALGMQLDIAERRLHLAHGQMLDVSQAHLPLLALLFGAEGGFVATTALATQLAGVASPTTLQRVALLITGLNRRFAKLPPPGLAIERIHGSGYRLALPASGSAGPPPDAPAGRELERLE